MELRPPAHLPGFIGHNFPFSCPDRVSVVAGDSLNHSTRPDIAVMKFIISILIAASCFSFSPIATAKSGWTDYVGVAELLPTSRHYYEVRLPVRKNPSSCREEKWFYINYDSPGADQMFEVLLEGVKSDLQVRVYVTGICNLKGYSEISAISVIGKP